MASLPTVIRTTLEGTASLTALLTGGIYDAGELGRLGLTPDTAGLYTGDILNPCAVIRWRGTSPFGPHFSPQSQRQFFEVYLYQDDGYATIDSALLIVKQTLHRTQYTADNKRLCWVNWAQDSGELMADELGFAALKTARFEVIYTEEL